MNKLYMNKVFTGYILAGGKSLRMGTDKAFLKIEKKSFIENALKILEPVCEKISVVLNKTQVDFIEKLPAETYFIYDIYENRGAPGGIYTALSDCRTEFAVILAVDLPSVSSEAIEKLCEIALDSENFSAIVPRQNNGKLQPLCAVYRAKDCEAKLKEILSKNASASVKYFLESVNTKIINSEYLSDNENLLININSPQDFLKFSSSEKSGI